MKKPPSSRALTGAHPDDGGLYRKRKLSAYFAPAAAGVGAVFWKLYVPPNFLLNRSTRPAVSTNFCLPVKNGWHAEQMSTLILASVLRVVNVLPHAQCTLQTWYFGWVFSFIGTTPWSPDVRKKPSSLRQPDVNCIGKIASRVLYPPVIRPAR